MFIRLVAIFTMLKVLIENAELLQLNNELEELNDSFSTDPAYSDTKSSINGTPIKGRKGHP